MKNKLKNPLLWTSIISTVLLILSATNIISIEDAMINTIVNSVLSVLALLGVVSTPAENTNISQNEDSKNKNTTLK